MSTQGEHQGNGIRFDMHLSAPNGGVAQMLCRPEGQWVSWNEYEKMKAEVERLNYKLGRLLGAEREWVLVEPEEYQRLKAKEGNKS